MILNIKNSYIFITIVLGAHSGALLLIFVLPIALWQKIGLAMLIGASLWWQGRYGIWASACEIKLEEDGSCIRTTNSEQRRYRVVRASAHAGFIRLTLVRAGERTRIQFIPWDTIEPELYRNLRAQILQRHLPVPKGSSLDAE